MYNNVLYVIAAPRGSNTIVVLTIILLFVDSLIRLNDRLNIHENSHHV